MYKYTHFIPENIAPVGSTKIVAWNSANQEICNFPLGDLTPPRATPLYTFAAISDPHVYEYKYTTSESDFINALKYSAQNCDFTCICGDLSYTATDSQLSNYKKLVSGNASNKPVYAIAGNHETSAGTYATDDFIKQYTGYPLYYTISNQPTDETKRNYYSDKVANDVFIMLGHYGAYHDGDGGWRSDEFVSIDELQFLYETLEANRNKRCFIFNHVYPYEDGVGDANRMYNGKYWRTQDGGIGQAFISLLKHYKNTILFHGHSHLRFYLQELDKKANYSSEVGYRSVHIPSLSVPRDLVDGAVDYVYAESEGYIVDVYDGYIILNGRDFIDNDADGHWLPIATYLIDTTLQTVAANTFTDSTGTIKTT